MTFITRINTPNTNIIDFGEDTVIPELVVTGNLAIGQNLDLSGLITASLGREDLTKSITFDCGTLSCPNGLTITGTLNSVFFDDFFILTRASNTRIGINTQSPADALHVVGDCDFGGEFNLDDLFYFDSASGRFGINRTNPSYTLDVNGNFLCGIVGSPYTASLRTINSTGRLGINEENPATRLHIRASTVSNKIVDTDAIIVAEKTGRGTLQIISSGSNSGIMFSAASLSSGAPSTNKHWAIFPAWGTVPGGSSYGTPSTRAPVLNDLCFGYNFGSNNSPFNAIIGGDIISPFEFGVFGYLKFDAVVDDINFTGQHRNLISSEEAMSITDKIGLIVISDGTYCETIDIKDPDNTTISINESLPKVKLSNSRNDKRVFGVISDKEDTESNSREIIAAARWGTLIPKKPNDHRLIINSVGEGAIWICNINGNLENGDYITSCEIPGYGMRQNGDDLKNYTVAKITCDCDFDLNSPIYTCEEFEFSGSIYRKAFVGCTYHCG